MRSPTAAQLTAASSSSPAATLAMQAARHPARTALVSVVVTSSSCSRQPSLRQTYVAEGSRRHERRQPACGLPALIAHWAANARFIAINGYWFIRASLRWQKESGHPESPRFRLHPSWDEAKPVMLLYRSVLVQGRSLSRQRTDIEREMRKRAARRAVGWITFMTLGLCAFVAAQL